jgi:hypothetical protein
MVCRCSGSSQPGIVQTDAIWRTSLRSPRLPGLRCLRTIGPSRHTRNVSVHHSDLTPLTPEHGILAALAFLRYAAAANPPAVEIRTPALVAAARHANISWARIGKALGHPGQYVFVLYRDLSPAPLPAGFPCMTEPLNLEEELEQERLSAFDHPQMLYPYFIAAARHEGVSWQRIANVLGVRRQTVHEKYKNLKEKPLPAEFELLTHVCEIHHAE